MDEAPYELSSSQGIDKFVTSDADSLLIAALPSKQFKILTSGSPPADSTLIQITKFKTDSALSNFYNFSLRPANNFRQLAKQIAHLYEPVALRTKSSGLVQVKELRSVLESYLKRKLTGEADLSFETI